ncbi:MAG: DUF3341 domain-containing protein [Gemmatimonadetes bacterium]|nr:DUF3341 domain-containing protein [Gemmatimonadota bacterium]
MAEFDNPDDLLEATKKARSVGYRRMDTYSPLPVHGMGEVLDFRCDKLPIMVFIAGVLGAMAGYGLCYYVSVIDYPLNVGGRPFHSGPSFIPVTFELTILFSALCAAFGMLIANGLPQPYHPVFNVESFARASQDRFFLCIEAVDEKYDPAATRTFLESLNPHEVSEVEN